jgi:Tfp pilus assembly protein PilO
MAQTESWHLNKSVPISLIIGLAIQAAGVIWMFSSMASDIDTNRDRLTKVETQVSQIEDTAQAQAVQLVRIETRLDALMEQSDRILRALEARP